MLIHESLTGKILGAAIEVSNTLGTGFFEKVYSRALMHEFYLRGLSAEEEVTFSVMYKDCCVGKYFADLVVEKTVVIELKCAERLTREHMAQCLNYLHASHLPLCLLLNFQHPTMEVKRIIQNN
ncbi:MAG: hypothetical protein JWP63_4448 [Candidatus Solibacter sp.]|nr:hypothetical protein [Candidatus Solibacter sp.]